MDINSLAYKIISEDHIWFELMTLKKQLVDEKRMCANCHTQKENWTINSKCHHLICQNCMDSNVHSKDTCPKCKMKFNSEVDLKTSLGIEQVYNKIERTVWLTMKHWKEALILIINRSEESSSNNRINLKNLDLSSFPNKALQEYINAELSPILQLLSTTSSDDTIEVIQHSESVNFDFNNKEDILLAQLILAKNKNLKSYMNNTDETNYLNDKLRADHMFSDDSKDEIIDGTPEKSNDLYPVISTTGDGNVVCSERIILSYSNLNSVNLEFVKKFVDFFNVELNSSWNDSVTHLVVQTGKNNTCKRTQKYLNALLSHCCIVSMTWIKDCLLHENILPEIDHIPIDSSTQQAALISWKVKKDHIKSPMEWTKDCILFFHSSIVQSHSDYSTILALAKKANFVIADRLDEFNDQFKLRFILVHLIKQSDEDDIIKQIHEHNVFPISLNWLIECLVQYRCVPISSEFQVIPVNEELIESVNMDKSYFVIDV